MKKKIKILVTWRIMIEYLISNKYLLKNKNFHFDFFRTKQSLNENDLKRIIHKYDGMICGDDQINKKVIDLATNLKVISKWGTGMDSINVDYGRKKGIKIFNTPNAFTDSVAQLAIAFILIFSRNVIDTHYNIRRGLWPKFKGFLINKKTLGIIGFGNIGKKIAKLVTKLGMKVIFHDIKNIKISKKQNIKKTSLTNVLKKSDIVVICCNLNRTSKNLIKMPQLKLMRKNSGIINVARGEIINEESLTKALKFKIISFAALDVFKHEPLKKSNPLMLMRNCILSSHNAFNTREQVNFVNINTLNNLFKGFKIKKNKLIKF